jgi:hypothetical protein
MEQAGAALTASPVSAGQGKNSQWKSIPEDSTSWQREPFKNLEPAALGKGTSANQGISRTSPDLALQGIMKSNNHYYAIINGRTVKPGDKVDGWSIAEISRYRVTIRRDKEKQIYDIYQGKIDRGTR